MVTPFVTYIHCSTITVWLSRWSFTIITENKRRSIWQLCRYWWHRKLSFRQLTVPSVTTKLSNWPLFVFSDCRPHATLNLTVWATSIFWEIVTGTDQNQLGLVFYLWLSKVSVNERRHYICNVFSHWLRHFSAIGRQRALVTKETHFGSGVSGIVTRGHMGPKFLCTPARTNDREVGYGVALGTWRQARVRTQ